MKEPCTGPLVSLALTELPRYKDYGERKVSYCFLKGSGIFNSKFIFDPRSGRGFGRSNYYNDLGTGNYRFV